MLIKVNKKIINTLIVNSLFLGGFMGSLSQFNAFGGISDVSTEYDVHSKNLSKQRNELRKLLNASEINWEKVKEIISKNPELLTVRNSNKETALHLAVQEENLGVVKALALRALRTMITGLKAQGQFGQTPLHLAVKSKSLKMVKALMARLPEADVKDCLKVQDERNWTPLHLAVESKSLKMVKALMAQLSKADVKTCLNVQDKQQKWTPLHLAVQLGNVDMVNALMEQLPIKDRQDCRYVRGMNQRTPIHLAKQKNNQNLINALQ
ncbi:MAG: ankyrin repeat domain-containing protein [Puniceicoccales bacterium]|jgi:ankyrin repeat protein|nr:ankyrin repeat domain-containing protein [Puniceicoccales bacterium]